MTMLNSASSWHVGKTAEKCAACGADLAPNAVCWAALCDGGLPAKPQPQGGEKDKKGKKDEPAEVSPFARVDFCEACWMAGKRPADLPLPAAAEGSGGGERASKLEMFSFWKTSVPVPTAKKKLLVDDSVLMDVFTRMEGRSDPKEIRFRFVLALILMRKRLLKYEETAATADGAERWKMLPRGGGSGGGGEKQSVEVINPHLTADQIAEVSGQLSAILAEEV